MAQPKQRTVTVVRVRPRKSIDKNQNIAFTPGKEVEISELMAKNRKLLDQEGYVLKSEYDAGNHEVPTTQSQAEHYEAEAKQLRAEIARLKAAQNLQVEFGEPESLPDAPQPEAETTEAEAPAKPKAARARKPSTRKRKA